MRRFLIHFHKKKKKIKQLFRLIELKYVHDNCGYNNYRLYIIKNKVKIEVKGDQITDGVSKTIFS